MIKEIPNIGLGTYLMKEKDVLKRSIKTAIESGYKHIDTAHAYDNEKEIGEILKELNVNRDDLFITSKILPQNYKFHIKASVDESLQRLQLKQLDLILLHVPVSNEVNISAYKELMTLRKEGKIRHIGVSNFTIDNLEAIKEATGEYPYCNQIILSPTQRIINLEKFCKRNNIILTGYSIMVPYFKPIQSSKTALTKEQRDALVKIAFDHKKDVGQILNRWALHIGYNVIPKSKTPSRVATNNQLLDFTLTDDELKMINGWNLVNEDEYNKKLGGWAERVTEEMFEKGKLSNTK